MSKLVTRKIFSKDVLLLKNLQNTLSEKKIALTQAELIDLVLNYAIRHQNKIITELIKEDPLKAWIKTPTKQGPPTNCTSEIDEVM